MWETTRGTFSLWGALWTMYWPVTVYLIKALTFIMKPCFSLSLVGVSDSQIIVDEMHVLTAWRVHTCVLCSHFPKFLCYLGWGEKKGKHQRWSQLCTLAHPMMPDLWSILTHTRTNTPHAPSLFTFCVLPNFISKSTSSWRCLIQCDHTRDLLPHTIKLYDRFHSNSLSFVEPMHTLGILHSTVAYF